MLRGQDAILNCSTGVSATGRNQIEWKHDHDIVSHPPCTSHSPGFDFSPRDSATDCNIRASGQSEHGISGAYICTDLSAPFDQSARAVAMVVVLGERHISYHILSGRPT